MGASLLKLPRLKCWLVFEVSPYLLVLRGKTIKCPICRIHFFLFFSNEFIQSASLVSWFYCSFGSPSISAPLNSAVAISTNISKVCIVKSFLFHLQMAAFRAALHSQVDCIEIDVSRSLDGILLVLHDRSKSASLFISFSFASLCVYNLLHLT